MLLQEGIVIDYYKAEKIGRANYPAVVVVFMVESRTLWCAVAQEAVCVFNCWFQLSAAILSLRA
jgi:hypothetical protein